MEKYFTPVCGSSEDELKLQKHQRLVSQHHAQHHRLNHHHHCRGPNDPLGEYRRFSDTHEPHYEDYQNHSHPHRKPVSTVPHHSQHKTLNRASTPSLSSSSSSSSSSCSSPWTSEPSLDNERYLLHNKPQHSLSCSNIPEARHRFQDVESEDLDLDQSDSAVYPHHRRQQEQQKVFGHSRQAHQRSECGPRMSQLHRGQSKSEEGLLQSPRAGKTPHPMESGPLYKTASLGHSLALKESTTGAAARHMAGPKRAVSSIQLPSKGILKNKDEGQIQGNVRKSKSMEVLSTTVQVNGPPKTVEMVKAEVLKEKLEFSAFLDEITRQVISPSRLSSFGITPSTVTASPKLPHEERRLPAKAVKQERIQTPTDQQSSKTAKLDGAKMKTDSSSLSHSHRRSHPNKKRHNSNTVSPLNPSQHQHQHHSHERRPCTTDSPTSSYKQQHRKYSQLLTDGTSTSPEPVLQEKYHHTKHKGAYQGEHGLAKQFHTGHEYKGSPPPTRPSEPESESPLSKSSTTASLSSEKSHKHKHMGHRRHPKNSRKDSESTEDRAELLEQYNKELHENLLQTVACIENMETELQCSKAELNSFKEKYKRLQESYTSCQQASNVLEQKLQSVVDSMNSERKYHLHRIMELTKQLDAAKNTIVSLENINIPSLIKELLDKHFHSQEAVRSFLLSSKSPGQSDTGQSEGALGFRHNQSATGKEENKVSDWLFTRQRNLSDRQQHVTAFLPWTESQDPWRGSEKTEACLAVPPPEQGHTNLSFTVADISQAIYRNIADEKATGQDPMTTVHHLGIDTEIHSAGMWRASDIPANPYSLGEIGSNRAVQRIEGTSGNAQMDPNEVNFISAQKMLDKFMSQIPTSAQEGPIMNNDVGRDWARRPADGL